jgi:CRP/FNR family transcriptional regulator
MSTRALRHALPRLACQSCPKCTTSQTTPWSALGPQDIVFLDLHKVPQTFPVGSTLYLPGTPCRGLYCVASGTLLIERISENGTRGVALLEAGEIAGWFDYFRGRPYSARATTLSESVVCHIPSKAVRLLIERTPVLATGFLLSAVAETDRIALDALEQRFASARQRLARALMILRQHHGVGAESGEIEIELPLSRRDLADLISIRPETLSRAIHELERDGVATFSGRNVHIPDLDRMLDELEIVETVEGVEDAVNTGAAQEHLHQWRRPPRRNFASATEGAPSDDDRPLDESA